MSWRSPRSHPCRAIGYDEAPMLTNTDPRACPYTQGWNCTTIVRETERCDYTNAAGCASGGGAGC
jgi:hypothetical protein